MNQTNNLQEETPNDVCPVCNLIHTGDGMVACDGCSQWYHFKCVNETTDVVNGIVRSVLIYAKS